MADLWSFLNSEFFNGLANASQIYDIALNLKQVSNDELMKELQTQDDLYFKKCIDQNEKIISQNKEIIEKLDILLIKFNERV